MRAAEDEFGDPVEVALRVAAAAGDTGHAEIRRDHPSRSWLAVGDWTRVTPPVGAFRVA